MQRILLRLRVKVWGSNLQVSLDDLHYPNNVNQLIPNFQEIRGLKQFIQCYNLLLKRTKLLLYFQMYWMEYLDILKIWKTDMFIKKAIQIQMSVNHVQNQDLSLLFYWLFCFFFQTCSGVQEVLGLQRFFIWGLMWLLRPQRGKP